MGVFQFAVWFKNNFAEIFYLFKIWEPYYGDL